MNRTGSVLVLFWALLIPIFCLNGQVKVINNAHYTKSMIIENNDGSIKKSSVPSSAEGYAEPRVIKPDFIANSFGGSFGAEQDESNIAVDGSGNYAVAWVDKRSGKKEIYAQFFDSQDNPVGDNVRVSDYSGDWNMRPSVAANKTGDFVISWAQTGNQILAQRFTSLGSKRGKNLQVNIRSGYNFNQPSAGLTDDGHFLIFWDMQDLNWKSNLYARLFDRSGNPVTGEISVSDQPGLGSSSSGWGNRVAVDSKNNFALVWSQNNNGISKIFLQTINSSGERAGNNVIISSMSDNQNHYFPSVAAAGSSTYLVVWEFDNHPLSTSGGVEARLYSYNGYFISGQIKLFDSPVDWHPCSVSSDGDSTFVVAWRGDTLNYMQKIRADGKLSGQTSSLTFKAGFPLYTISPVVSGIRKNQFYVTFSTYRLLDRNIYFQKFNTDFSIADSVKMANNDPGSAWQGKPLIGFNDQGGYIILWEDSRNGKYDLFGQVFDSRNNPVGNNIQVNDERGGYWFLKEKAVKALSDGTFIVAFTGSPDFPYSNVFMQRVSPLGEKIGPNAIIDDHLGYDNTYKPVLNVDRNDNILLVWYLSDIADGSAFMRKFDRNLVPDGSRITLAQYDEVNRMSKSHLSLSISKDLKVLASWIYRYSEKGNYSNKINGAVYDEKGFSLTGEMVLDTVRSGEIVSASGSCIGEDNWRDYVLTWKDIYGLHIKRSYYSDSPYSFSDIMTPEYSDDMPQITAFKNRKLFMIRNVTNFSPDKSIFGYYFNDNRSEKYFYTLYKYDSTSAPDFVSHHNNSAAILDNKLVFAYESCRNGQTGFDIWARVVAIDNINFKPEQFLKPINNDMLYPNVPNPFNSTTKISYQIYSFHKVRLAIYDILGREVKVLVDDYQEKGFYDVNFDASGLPSGVYLCRLETFNTLVNKMIYVK